MKPILEAIGISKCFSIQHQEPYLSFRDKISNLFKSGPVLEDFWALSDIHFSIEPGESVGIIGRNGAGKSTLLKILSKITPPTTGKITYRGRIASLLEVGTGFHPELTGRENIFLNGSILGMPRREIVRHFDRIVEFAGTEKFLDTPLKQYSSGMQLRLAFSVAAHLNPEILVIDEVLAVGDAEFQKKCLGKMEDISRDGRTVLFVSHNMAAVGNLCTRGILLDQGKIVKDGAIDEVVDHYQSLMGHEVTGHFFVSGSRKEDAYFSSIKATLSGTQPEMRLLLECEIVSQRKHKDAFLAFDISNSIGVPIMQAIPEFEPFVKPTAGLQKFRIQIDLPPLIPDVYRLSAWMGSHNTETLCWDKEIIGFEILQSPSQGRNFPHSHSNGFVVPPSRIVP